MHNQLNWMSQAGLALALLLISQTGQAIDGNWTYRSHPCLASQTNALHRDEDGALWVGCGSGQAGRGLWRRDDQGQSWKIPETQVADIIEFFRVFDISRGHDGGLYLSGVDSRGGLTQRVIGLNTAAGEPFESRIALAICGSHSGYRLHRGNVGHCRE